MSAVADGHAFYAFQLFAQFVADGNEVAVVQANESSPWTLCHQCEELLGCEHGFVVDGNFSFHLEPSVVRLEFNIPS